MRIPTFVLPTIMLGAIAVPVMAHHSTLLTSTAQRTTIDGRLTKVEWANPHVFLYIDVVDSQNGKMVNWTIQTANPKDCIAKGLISANLQPGTSVSVKGAQRAPNHWLEALPEEITLSSR